MDSLKKLQVEFSYKEAQTKTICGYYEVWLLKKSM